jgi:hypothetical protein
MTTSTIDQRVQAGMAFLDQHEPGWTASIDLDQLDMSRCDRCVLGQVYGDYGTGLTECDRLSVEPYFSTIAHGFSTGVDDDDSLYEYEDLTTAWRTAISARRDGEQS